MQDVVHGSSATRLRMLEVEFEQESTNAPTQQLSHAKVGM